MLLRRNYGQTAAMAAGFNHAAGDVVVALDSDLQNDPRDIPALVAKLNEGYDAVSGWRKNRKDNFIRTLPSKIANYIIGRVTGVSIHDYGCTLKAYNREVLNDVNLYGEMHRFIPALVAIQGGKVTEMVVNHRPRVAGSSKYGLSRTFRVLLDIITIVFLSRFLTRPLHFFGYFGAGCFGVSGLLLAYVVLEKYRVGFYMHRNPLFIVACIVFLTGFQLITAGLLGELISRSYFESQGRSIYRIRSKHGF